MNTNKKNGDKNATDAAGAPLADAGSGRNSVTVQFDYQLEVNSNSNVWNQQQQGSDSQSPTEQALRRIDRFFLGSLQQQLPNGGLTRNSQMVPTVKFEGVESEIFSMCFTSSDYCSLVRTTISITYEGDKPEHAVERVAYRLIQEYLADFPNATDNQQVMITYLYPFLVSSLAQFQLYMVDSTMGSTEIQIMEDTFLQVFGATVFAIEGDTEITDVEFIYQDIEEVSEYDNGQQRLNSTGTALSANFYVHGICRECSEVEFSDMVNAVFANNLEAYESKLKVNAAKVDSTYFDDVNYIEFAVPELPSDPPPIEDDTIYDSEPPETNTLLPWYFFLGISMAVCVIFGGIYVTCKDVNDLENEKEEEEFSTGSESAELSEEVESQIEEYVVKDLQPIEHHHNNRQISMDEYQVETILSDGDNNDAYAVSRIPSKKSRSYNTTTRSSSYRMKIDPPVATMETQASRNHQTYTR